MMGWLARIAGPEVEHVLAGLDQSPFLTVDFGEKAWE